MIDFSDQRIDSVWIDPVRLILSLQRHGNGVKRNRRRLGRLRDAFLCGYARPWEWQRPEFQLVWTAQQIERLKEAIGQDARSWTDRYRRRQAVLQVVYELNHCG